MKNHPLTPMWDSRIKALIETQSKYHAYEWDTTDLNTSAELLRKNVWKFLKIIFILSQIIHVNKMVRRLRIFLVISAFLPEVLES